MKYLVIFLVLIGFAGLWQLSFAEMNYPDALKIPFNDSDLVLVGTIISKDKISNQTKYGIDVDDYLKNSKSFDMISAISYETKNQTDPYTEVNYYNEPFFDVGQKVFVYLKMNISGEYIMSAHSFALEKNEAKGPPATNLFPLFNKYEYKYGENVTISGIVKKAYLYFESLKDEDTNVYVTVLNPENKQYLSDKVHINQDGTFDYSFTPKGNLAIGGLYSYSIGTKQESWQGGFLVDILTTNASPYKQHKSGITNDKIVCKDGLIRLIKSTDNSPICVKFKTVQKLVEREYVVPLMRLNSNLVVPRGDLFLQQLLRIEGINDTYGIGQKIEFTVKFNGTKYGCYSHPTLRIDDSNHQKVWEGNYILELCDPDTIPTHFEKIWDTSDSNLGVPILNKTGTYTLFAEFEKNIIQQDFMVKQEIVYANPCKESNELDLEKIPQVGEPSRLVFSVKQNTTAHICIKYSSNRDNEGTLNLNAESNDGYLVTYNGTKSNVSVTINPSFIPLQKGQSTIADYTISVPQDADGVYWLEVSQMCGSIPIITSNHKIIPDDIPVVNGFHSCPAISLDAKIIGFSGADAQYHIAKALKGR